MVDIPRSVEIFLSERIHSVYELELLLILRANREKEWTPLNAAHAIRVEGDAVVSKLNDLCSAGLVQCRNSGKESFYRYSPETREVDALVDDLAVVYENSRVRITSMIVNNAFDNIRTFADEFIAGRE
jgi:hypothetical protein